MKHFATFLLLLRAAFTFGGNLQSGADLAGSTFPAAGVYDEPSNSVTIVGSTFGRFWKKGLAVTVPRSSSSCFLSTVNLSTMQFAAKQTYGDLENTVPESCSNGAYVKKHQKFIALGYSERGSVLEALYSQGQLIDSVQYGMLLDTDTTDASDPYKLTGGRVLQESRINYPIDIAVNDADAWIYVVSQVTEQVVPVPRDRLDLENATASPIAFERDPARFFNFDGKYRMRISRYSASSFAPSKPGLQETLSEDYNRLYATDDNRAVHIAGILEIGDHVIVGGTTDGVGAAFGSTFAVAPDTLDGFITKFDKVTGRLNTGVSPTTRRIESLDKGDEYLVGMCHNNDGFLYIVGSTDASVSGLGAGASDGSIQAYIQKIDVATLATVWSVQIGALPDTEPTMVRGVSCAADGDFVWLAGVAQDGSVVIDSGLGAGFGRDDVFVSKFYAEDGGKILTRQLGSEEDDGLAMHGALVLDKAGNAVLIGNTFGSLYRSRPESEIADQPAISDVFVTTIDRNSGESSTTRGNGGSGSPIPPSSGTIVEDKDYPRYSAGTIMVLVLVSLFLLAALFVSCRQRPKMLDVTTDRSKVISYLNDFDVEDIDLKHSATGGFHCSYANTLAHGFNRAATANNKKRMPMPPNDPLLVAPLTSIADDSLFMDEDDGEYGLSRFGETSGRHGYEGLINDYNAGWDNRRRRRKEDNFSGIV